MTKLWLEYDQKNFNAKKVNMEHDLKIHNNER